MPHENILHRGTVRMKKMLISLIVMIVAVSCNAGREKIYRDSRIAMDTIVTISVVTGDRTQAKTAIDRAFAEIERISALIDFFSDNSELSLINRNAGKRPVRVSPETLELVTHAMDIARETGGAFDPTVGAVSVLWDFTNRIKPDRKELKERLKLVSYRNVVVDSNRETVFLKKEGMMMDLGGIAKGYAADRAVDILKEDGIKAALVAVAGDIRGYGLRPDGRPWMVGLQDPRPASATQNILAAFPLHDMAVSTSGDYQRYFESEGRRYHHLLVPSTGMPSTECQSVSVITERATLTDALSTAVFIMGPEKGLAFLKKKGYEGVIVDYYGRIHVTEGIRDVIEIKRPGPDNDRS